VSAGGTLAYALAMARSGASEPALAARRTAIISIVAAGVLVVLKLGVGVITGSLGLISTGIESSGDLVAATLTFFVIRLGGRPADTEHPYGHRRAENLGALGEAAILLAGGVVVALEATRHLIESATAPDIHWYQFAVIGAALVVDLSRTVVSLRTARRFRSAALRSNAFHFAGDMAGSVAVLVGLLAVRAGVDEGDSIAALLVAGIIAGTAVRLLLENANVLMDRTPAEARLAAERAIAALGADIELTRLRLRESAGRYFADVVVTVPPAQAVVEGHQAANMIESALEAALPGSDVVVHVEPRRSGLRLRERVLAIALEEPAVMEAHDIAIFQRDGALDVSMHLKFPADMPLAQAAEAARRVERRVTERAGVANVQTHLEPLEGTLVAAPPDGESERATLREIDGLVRAHTGKPPRDARLLATGAGPVVFLTLAVDASTSLSDAHALAGELEDELRKRIASIADVVVHTEP
jgi:cation diffusion facilitator family transporter